MARFGLARAALLVLAGTAVVLAGAPDADRAVAAKARCTIVGTEGKDRLRGTNERDVICARAGGDRIVGRGGQDLIRGGEGADTIRGKGGKDRLLGGSGGDRLRGGTDDDIVIGGSDGDELDGGMGFNKCPGAAAPDLIDTTCRLGYRIDSIELSPAVVDTSLADAQVQLTMHITDTWDEALQVGDEFSPFLSEIAVGTHSPLDGFDHWRPDASDFPLELIEGDADSGTWSGPVTLYRGAAEGPHPISLVLTELADYPSWAPVEPGTQWKFTQDVSQTVLAGAGLDAVIEQVGPGDPGPNLRGLEISPRVVSEPDTPGDFASFQVIAEVANHSSWIDDVAIELEGEGGDVYTTRPASHSRGEDFESTWIGDGSLRQAAPEGTYRIAEVRLTVGATTRVVDTARLEQLGFDPSFEYGGPS